MTRFIVKIPLQHIANTFDDNTDCVFGGLYIYTDKKEKVKKSLRKAQHSVRGAFKKGWMPRTSHFLLQKKRL